MDRSIFKAYDIRGTVPDQLDAEGAYAIGRATAAFLAVPAVAVGRDARASSPEIHEALVRGVNDEGVDVLDLGLISTPMLYFGVEHLGAGGGIMITASHNPAQYNGFKVCREHAIPVGEASGLVEIQSLLDARSEAAVAATRGRVIGSDVREPYTEHVLSVGGRCPPLKIVIDCGNGMASVGLESLLPRLPVDVVPLYFELDGTFPNHPADPLVPENLEDVCDAVRRNQADFGVAFDGDGDRAIFVDGTGQSISSDLITALLARRLLAKHAGGLVLFDLRSSRAVAEEIERAGGVAEMSRVGHSFVKAQMRETGAIFAGELSGHMYFRFSPTLVADDGTAALVALLDVLANERESLADLIAPLRRYSASGEINRRVSDVAGVLRTIEQRHRDAPEVSKLDGLLVRYPDWWFNLRPSNTEPMLRLNLEADTHGRMVEERDRLLTCIEGIEAGP